MFMTSQISPVVKFGRHYNYVTPRIYRTENNFTNDYIENSSV